MNLCNLIMTFRYNPVSGRLRRGHQGLVKTESREAGRPQYFKYLGELRSYSLVCFAIHHGYFPKEVCYRDGNPQNNRAKNLYDPAPPDFERPQGLGVTSVSCGRTGALKGFMGSVYIQDVRHCTPIVETLEMARDLRLLLAAQVEWEAQQKETAQ